SNGSTRVGPNGSTASTGSAPIWKFSRPKRDVTTPANEAPSDAPVNTEKSMQTLTEEKTELQQPAPLRLSRVLHARRETVFKACSPAEHIKRWFCPATFTIPDAKVEMQVGGPFEVCMLSPAGEKHWIRGTFVEVAPHTRLVIDMRVADGAGKPLFRA